MIEVDERVGADGEIVRTLDLEQLRVDLTAAHAGGFRSIAVVLMHGWRFTEHEAMVADLARAVGFAQVSVSHQVSPLMKFVARGDTTVVHAYLSPILRRHIDQVAGELPGTRLFLCRGRAD